MYSEKQHFSAILFSHPMLFSCIEVLDKLLVGKYEHVQNTTVGNGETLSHIYYITKTKYHRFDDEPITTYHKKPKSRKIGGETHYLYDCYLMEIPQLNQDTPLYLFSSPFKNLLKDSINSSLKSMRSEKLTFNFIDLSELIICLSKTNQNPDMTISRMNLQAIGPIGVRSVALYGDDVLLSALFDSIKKYTNPSSVRLVYNEDSKNTFSINTDRAGNWSFYLKKQQELYKLHKIFAFILDNELVRKTYNDPRLRRSLQDEILEAE